MKITDLIEGFEELTDEEKMAKLAELEIPEAKNVDLTKYVEKSKFDKIMSENASLTKKQRESLSEAEREKLEWEEYKKETEAKLASYERKSTIDNYEKRLQKLGFADVAKMAESLPNDIEDSFFDGLEKWKTEFEKNFKAESVKKMPRPEGGKADNEMTKEQFDKLGYTELAKLKEDNPELYDKMNNM